MAQNTQHTQNTKDTEISADPLTSCTLEQKASLTSGLDFWHTKAVPGVPSIMLTDGPHGVRKQVAGSDHLGLQESVPSTCFPPAVTLGSSWDPELLVRVGAALGDEAQALGVGVLLGPGINIKRSPLCGRNFEYLSEDPLVSGVLGAALVRGLQGRGVGASVKHFAVNNQESDRLRVSADVDMRPLREIYLRGFERVVTSANPWTVMCSYNRVNGVYASQNRWLLSTVLRDEWGFDGLVMSDWGAVDDRVVGIAAGLDLEMPASGGRTDAQVVAAVQDGTLDERVVDVAAGRVATLVARVQTNRRPDATFDVDDHHALAREAAAASIVLLRNDDDLLPLPPSTSVAVIGEFARTPRYQGAGSSMVNPTRLDCALDAIRSLAGEDVVFAPGFALAGSPSADDAAVALRAEAVAAAAAADVAVVFLGLPASAESEGFDRSDIELPADQVDLLDAVLDANPRTVAVLANGGVVRLAGVTDRVPALVEGWLLGQAGGAAVADVLYGVVNPSGRLAETVPDRLQDTPAYLDFPGEHGHVRYGEGLFVGYRWYDARAMGVSFPFGHGLSYTTFAYSDLELSAAAGGFVARLVVTNTGERDGSEVVQLYASLPGSSVARAPRELRAFAKVTASAGESRTVELPVSSGDLAYFDTRADRWVVEGGSYRIEVGASSRDLRLSADINIEGDDVRFPVTRDSSISEALQDETVGPAVRAALGGFLGDDDSGLLTVVGSFPLGRVASFPGVDVSPAQLDALLGG
ncbi:glycoside hydrolase family 3 C-terminal domain-containing protein [Lapillicoccus sp.]|uniref:glycoside hydrolase family 3 C-terminal domain-containing protein n=1 Tax=Lapillicoccus sp. TaxID=1909287 RepID=UPI003262CDFE